MNRFSSDIFLKTVIVIICNTFLQKYCNYHVEISHSASFTQCICLDVLINSAQKTCFYYAIALRYTLQRVYEGS